MGLLTGMCRYSPTLPSPTLPTPDPRPGETIQFPPPYSHRPGRLLLGRFTISTNRGYKICVHQSAGQAGSFFFSFSFPFLARGSYHGRGSPATTIPVLLIPTVNPLLPIQSLVFSVSCCKTRQEPETGTQSRWYLSVPSQLKGSAQKIELHVSASQIQS